MEEKTVLTRNGSEGIMVIDAMLRRRALTREEVVINFSRNYDRKTSSWIEETIDKIWDEKCQTNTRLYNRSKFRLSKIAQISSEKHLIIDVGLTSYRELMGTNCHTFGKELMEYAIKNDEKSHEYLADVLGVGSLLLTSDQKFVFIRRALWTAEDRGKLDRPGGHPEPENVSPGMQAWTEIQQLNDENSTKIRNEIFDSVLHEISDEVNLPISTLTDPSLLGIVRSFQRLGRPSAEFFVRCSLTSDQVEALYLQSTQPEADESVGIVFLPEENIRDKNLDPSVWEILTDSACGAIELYSRCVCVNAASG